MTSAKIPKLSIRMCVISEPAPSGKFYPSVVSNAGKHHRSSLRNYTWSLYGLTSLRLVGTTGTRIGTLLSKAVEVPRTTDWLNDDISLLLLHFVLPSLRPFDVRWYIWRCWCDLYIYVYVNELADIFFHAGYLRFHLASITLETAARVQ